MTLAIHTDIHCIAHKLMPLAMDVLILNTDHFSHLPDMSIFIVLLFEIFYIPDENTVFKDQLFLKLNK